MFVPYFCANTLKLIHYVMKRIFFFTIQLSILFCFVFSQQINAQKKQDLYKIGIISGAFTPEVAKATDFDLLSSKTFNGKYFRLLQFYDIPTLEQRGSWESQGLYLTDYLPGNIYFAVIGESFNMRKLQHTVRAILEVDNRFRMEPKLAAIRDRGQSSDKLTVSYYATLDAKKVIADLESRGVAIENHRDYSRQLDITIDPSRLDEIVALPYIQFIGAQPGEPELESYYSNSTGRANYLNTGYNGLNYTGNGITIAIGEGGTVDNHIDFRGRLTEMVSGSASTHKIGVMLYAGGSGNEDPTEKNNAHGATLLSVDWYPDYAALYTSHNLRFTNHSYGTGVEGGYDQKARDHDLLTASYPLHLISYSAGNKGTLTGYAPYNFQYWGNLTGAYKGNKTHLVAGALNPDDEITAFSSRGPAYDGRILPHLIIEGQAGTSNASPKLVGLMAILAEVYKDKNGGTEADAGLLRTILMNTADDLGNSGPDFKYGYGKPNARRAYNVIDNSQFLTSSVANGNTNTHNITVPANTKQVRVMLVWPDAAAAVNANPAIVNNLNLLVKDPPATTSYNPWVLDHTANPTNLDLPATRQVDALNTIEQVTVDNPASGSWTIEVNGASVPSGPQTYYITYEFLMDELHLGFPLKDVRFESGENYRIKWDSYGVSGTFDLDYQIDGGSWVNIVSGYDAASRSYNWEAPSVIGIQPIKIRVTRGALSEESDICYIGDVPVLSIDWACGDAMNLKWTTVSGATSYKIYRFVSDHMEEVTTNITFDGTSALLTGLSTTESEYFSVSAVTGSYEGLRSYAKEKTVGDDNCNMVLSTMASEVNKTNITLNGLVNPHNTTLTEVHFEYGPTTAYGSSAPNISTSATGHTEEAVSSTIASTLTSRTDIFHYRLVAKSDGTDVYGEDQEIRLAPGRYISCTGGYYKSVNCGNEGVVTGANPRSVSLWAYTDVFNDERPLFKAGASGTTGSDFSLSTLTTDDQWRVVLGGTADFDITLTGSKQSWHHYCLTYDGTDVKLYYDGNLAGSSTVALNTVLNDFFIAKSDDNNSDFDGKIDEVSYWRKALSETEIRALMHQPLAGSETDLVKYFPFDGVYTRIYDFVTGQEVSFSVSVPTSNCPVGLGSEFTATETAGNVSFTGTDFSANYSNQNGATVIVSKIEIEPNSTNGFPVNTTVFDNQYWVAHRHGSGSFLADVTFTVSEDLTAADQNIPSYIQLYSRDKGSYGDWSFVTTASSVSDADEKATFNGIDTFDKQFILSRNTDPIITASEVSLIFIDAEKDGSYQQHSYDLSGTNLTDNLNVTPPTGFQVSTNAGSGFASSLSLPPSGGSVSETIYVRLTPSTVGFFSGDVANSSTGATTVNVNIPEVEVYDAARNALEFDGSDDYIQLTQNSGLPIYNNGTNNAYTVCMWVKGNAQNDKRVFSEGRSSSNNPLFAIGTNTSGKVRMYIRNNSNSELLTTTSANTVFDGNWHHIAWVDNDGSATLYVDGVVDGNDFNYTRGTLTLDRSAIGAVLRASPASFFSGQIDEVSLWNVARTQSEIQDDMHRTLNGDETNLVAYYRFNRVSGTVLTDKTTNNNDGTLINMTDADWVSSTSPIPYNTVADGNWSTDAIWNTGQNAPTSDWARAEINNDITLTSDEVLKELTINSGKSLTINTGKSLTVSGSLTNNAGVSGIVIESDASGTGSLLQPSSGVDASVQRYVAQNNYHYISSPVSNMAISPQFVTTNPIPVTTDFYKFDEPTNMWINIKDVNGDLNTSFETNFEVNRGYALAYTDNTYIKTFAGELNYADQTTINLTRNTSSFEGWNLVGNPFPATLAANNAADATNNFLNDNAAVLDNSFEGIYLWNGTDYTTVNQATGATYISPAQGFFVKAATNNAQLQINTAIQKQAASTFYKSGDIARFTIGVTSQGNDYNETMIAFVNGASKGLDPGFDSQKLKGNPNLALYSILVDDDGGDYIIQCLPVIAGDQHVKLGFDASQPGIFEFGNILIENMPDQVIILEDKTLNTFTNLNINPTYAFSLSQPGSYENRFELHFGSIITGNEELLSQENTLTILSDGSVIIFQNTGNKQKEGVYEIYNIAGQILDVSKLIIEANSQLSVRSVYMAGLYFVRFTTEDSSFTQKIILK